MVADLGSSGQRAKIAPCRFRRAATVRGRIHALVQNGGEFGNRLAHNGPVFSTHTGPLGADTT